jgi:hypothetical protein
MAKTKIPLEDQERANIIVADFNKATFKKKEGIEYYAEYKGDFLYLNLKEGKKDGPVARLKYTGKFNDWNFAIYKWSCDRYDPDEWMFPGAEYINGTIEGALKAVLLAYPPEWTPSEAGLASFPKQLFGK